MHSYIVMQFKKEERSQVKVNIDPEEKSDQKLKLLDDEYEGPIYEIVG